MFSLYKFSEYSEDAESKPAFGLGLTDEPDSLAESNEPTESNPAFGLGLVDEFEPHAESNNPTESKTAFGLGIVDESDPSTESKPEDELIPLTDDEIPAEIKALPEEDTSPGEEEKRKHHQQRKRLKNHPKSKGEKRKQPKGGHAQK